MAAEYRLCLEGERWSIIDEATLEPARLDGVPLATMEAAEAKHMLKILKGLDRVRKASKKSASTLRKNRFNKPELSPSQTIVDAFAPLRPIGRTICAACFICTGACTSKRSETSELPG